jgi:hypothetical protein
VRRLYAYRVKVCLEEYDDESVADEH